MNPLTVALMGLNPEGVDCLSATRSLEQLKLIAVGDGDAERLRRHTESLSLRTYEDYRSLILEASHAGLDILIVSLEPFQSMEFVEMAASRGIAVFHKAPWARTVEEGRRMIDLFADRSCPLVVSRWWQFEPAFRTLADITHHCGHVFAATASIHTADTSAGWRGDARRAGGGVLLNGAYEILDMLVHTMGMPESVYAQCGFSTEPGSARPYDTEDFTFLSLSLPHDRKVSLVCARGAAESDWRVTFYGTRATVEVSPDRLIYTPRDGGAAQQHKVWAKYPIVHAIGAFAESLTDDQKILQSTAKEHLATMALIQAAYLSAKTGEPESPSRMLD